MQDHFIKNVNDLSLRMTPARGAPAAANIEGLCATRGQARHYSNKTLAPAAAFKLLFLYRAIERKVLEQVRSHCLIDCPKKKLVVFFAPLNGFMINAKIIKLIYLSTYSSKVISQSARES